MKKTLIGILLLVLMQSYGCLVVENISYSIKLNENGGGQATLTFVDIQSDAIGNNEFDEDKDLLFNYILKSEDFLKSMNDEGKSISGRELIPQDGKLNGKVVYTFEDITRVEGMRKEGGFIYLTLQLEDSVAATNGEMVITSEYKRIIWEAGTKELTFTVLSADPERVTRPLLPFYKK